MIIEIVRCADLQGRRIAAQLPIDQFNDTGTFGNTEKQVNLGQLLLEILLIALRQTTGHDQHPAGAAFLVVGDLQNGIDGLFLGIIDKGTGVDDDNIRLTFINNNFKALGRQMAQHHLGIDQVFRAAEADQTDF